MLVPLPKGNQRLWLSHDLKMFVLPRKSRERKFVYINIIINMMYKIFKNTPFLITKRIHEFIIWLQILLLAARRWPPRTIFLLLWVYFSGLLWVIYNIIIKTLHQGPLMRARGSLANACEIMFTEENLNRGILQSRCVR